MTGSDLKRKKFITPERAAIILPTIISAFISFIIFSAFAEPKYVSSNRLNNELKEYKRKVNELAALKLQSQIITKNLEKLKNEKERIINLISGTSNLDTFIKRLGTTGEKYNISFKSIKPISSLKYVGSNNSDIQDELNINIDPLLVEGVKKYTIDVKFDSQYKDLLAFLRELEFQENIILFSDMNIELKEEKGNLRSKTKSSFLDVSLKMIVYGKI